MHTEDSSHPLNPESNDTKSGAAIQPGTEIFSMLQPRSGERILDVGCGTGDFMAEMAASGAIPTGIDLSEDMVGRARQKHPELNILAEDICHYRSDERFDAVFSNAALHWIKDAPAAARSIWLALRDGGRFVAEFAGSGNVSVLTAAMKQEMEKHGYSWSGQNPWYHPTIGEYASLLEQIGFRVTLAEHFDKLAPMKGESGIRNWLNSFTPYFFPDIASSDKASIFRAIEDNVKTQLYRGDQWFIDTSRLRIVAIKESG